MKTFYKREYLAQEMRLEKITKKNYIIEEAENG